MLRMPYLHTSIIICSFFPDLPQKSTQSPASTHQGLRIPTPMRTFAYREIYLFRKLLLFIFRPGSVLRNHDISNSTFQRSGSLPSIHLPFFAENEKITVSHISIRNSQIIPALFLFLLFSVIFFPVFFFLFNHMLSISYLRLYPGYYALSNLQTDLSDIHRLQSVLQMTLLQPVCLLYKLRQTICPVSPEV